MAKTYRLDHPEDVLTLNRLLNPFGIHFEYDLMNHIYLLVDENALKLLKAAGGRPRKISPETREKARRLKAEGMSVRRIAEKLSLSIGTVSNITGKGKGKHL